MTVKNIVNWNNKHLISYLSPSYVEIQLISNFETNKINNIKLEAGKNKTGLRKKFVQKNWKTMGEEISKSCPSCGLFHTIGYYQALEEALGITQNIPLDGKLARILFQEWSRLGSYLKVITTVIHNSGAIGMLENHRRIFNHFNKFPQIYSGERDMNLNDLIQIGGVKLKPVFKAKNDLKIWINDFTALLEEIRDSILVSGRMNHFNGLGDIHTNKARDFSPVGINARAIGLSFDVRLNDPNNGYDKVVVNLPALHPGKYGILDLFLKYFDEIKSSLDIIMQIIVNFDLETVSLTIDEKDFDYNYSESWSKVETPGGETNYYLKLDSNLNILDFTWQSPTLTNWQFFAYRVKGNPIESFNLLFDISGFCFYCLEE